MHVIKPYKFMLVLYVTILIVTGSSGESYDGIHRDSGHCVKESLKKIVSSVGEVIKTFKNEHTIGNEGRRYYDPMKSSLAKKCRSAIRAHDLTLTAQANEIIKILQEFVGALQQMQIDEVGMHEKKELATDFKLTRLIRHLEYDLRNVTEEKLRRFIKEYIGPVKVPYSLGRLPSNISSGAPKSILIMHYYKLHFLRSCIIDILHIDRWMHLMNDNSTTEILDSRDELIC